MLVFKAILSKISILGFTVILLLSCGQTKDPVEKAINRNYDGNFKMSCRGTIYSELNTILKDVDFSYELSRIVGGKYLSEAHVRRKQDDLNFNLGIGVSAEYSVSVMVLGEDGCYILTGDQDAISVRVLHVDSKREPNATPHVYKCEKTYYK